MDKKGRYSTLLFVLVILLPLLGVLIMDYQLTKANDITGASAFTDSIPFDSTRMISTVVSVVVVVVALSIFLITKVVKPRKTSSANSSSTFSSVYTPSSSAPSSDVSSDVSVEKKEEKEIEEQKEVSSNSLLEDTKAVNAEIERLSQELKSL
jgi:hypothetical protein